MITYLIIDDEDIAHDIIKGYCDMLPNLKLMKHCYDALEALDYLRTNTVDLIFLDLNMPKLKGFDFLRTLHTPPKVIVTTAYSEFALEGYELNVTDYLLKPFSFERFLKAINKSLNSVSKEKSIRGSDDLQHLKSVFLRSNKKHIQVFITTILYIEAMGNYTKIVLDHETVTVREKISDIIELLPKNEFVQVHKSFAVSVKHIHSIEGNRITIKNYTIPIGKLYKMNINELLSNR